MPDLKYIGPDPETLGGRVPLPEGWPALDHAEPDEGLAAEKVESGHYALLGEEHADPTAEEPAAARGGRSKGSGRA